MNELSVLNLMSKLITKIDEKIEEQKRLVDIITKVEGDKPAVHKKEHDDAMCELKALLKVKTLVLGEVINSLDAPVTKGEK